MTKKSESFIRKALDFMEKFEGCAEVVLLEQVEDYYFCKYVHVSKRLMELRLYNLGDQIKPNSHKNSVRL